jgi:hypothetical protein
MARTGVTFADVSSAADQLVAAGERPSTERVRLALGRGSPNTIAPLLERWWTQLMQRLHAREALPGVPDEVAAAFAHAWAAALAAGQAHAEGLVAPERAALADVLAKAEAQTAARAADLARLEAELQRARVATEGTNTALTISEQRVGDLQRELAAMTDTAQAVSQQREAAEARVLALTTQRDAERTAAAKERDALQTLLKQVEDRAYGEVDRTRQEHKALKAQLVTQARVHASALRASEQQRRAAEAALASAQRDLARRPPAKVPRRASAPKPATSPGRRRKSA